MFISWEIKVGEKKDGREGGREGKGGEERRISRGSRGCRADLRQRTGLFERKPGAAGWLRREILGSALGPSQDCPAKQEPCGRPAPAGGAGRTIDKEAESAQAEQARALEVRAPSGIGHLQVGAAAATYRQITPRDG